MLLLIKECLTTISLVQMWAWNPGYPHPKARDFSWLTGYFFLPKLIKIQTPIYLTRGVWNPHLGKVKLIGKEKKIINPGHWAVWIGELSCDHDLLWFYFLEMFFPTQVGWKNPLESPNIGFSYLLYRAADVYSLFKAEANGKIFLVGAAGRSGWEEPQPSLGIKDLEAFHSLQSNISHCLFLTWGCQGHLILNARPVHGQHPPVLPSSASLLLCPCLESLPLCGLCGVESQRGLRAP